MHVDCGIYESIDLANVIENVLFLSPQVLLLLKINYLKK